MSEIGRLIRSAGEEALAPHHADEALQGESDTYTLETVIGHGGMGATVYLAQTSHGKRVALKLLPEELAENPRLAKRFAREAKLMRGISHRHIVRLLAELNSGSITGQ